MAAVIGVPHEKWDERPLLIVSRRDSDAGKGERPVRLVKRFGQTLSLVGSPCGLLVVKSFGGEPCCSETWTHDDV
jgi:acyl-CoA synthetase (AMP-forming)/AMP-acid ligase II